MKLFLFRLLRLLLGLSLFSVGIVMTIQANIGYAPWDVFHAGLSQTTGLSFGLVSILVGLAFLVVVLVLGEKFGLGTLLNMVIIGALIDVIMNLGLIPRMNVWYTSYPLLLAGLLVIAFGSYFYIHSGFGAGPRDSLMLALTRKTGWSLGLCRISVELSVLVLGYFMGGQLGFGTLIAAFAVGIFVQAVFKLLRFDASKLVHETLQDTLRTVLKSYPKTE